MSEKSKSSDEEILRIARDRFKLAEEASSNIRSNALDDLEFRAGEQWPSDVKNARNFEARPCLTINRVPQFIRNVTNDQKQNRSAIKVTPFDDKADIDTAKIIQGIIRHIEYDSNADVAYDSAFEGAAVKGFGYFRVLTEYVDPMSFDQEIKIKKIPNDFSVYFDPTSSEPDGSDANWAFIIDDVLKDDYECDYKDSELASMDDWTSIGDQASGWIQGKSCRVAEYFYKEFKEITLIKLSNGETYEKSKLPQFLPADIQIIGERKSTVPVVYWCKINGVEILEKTIWPGQYIPVIPVYGDMLNVNGEVILEGVIRHAKDSQRMYNYMASTEAETIALAPKAPFIAAEGQIPKEYEAQWKTANSKTHAFLVYKPTSLGGQLVGPPQRNIYEAPVQAITNARMQASEDMKATTGIYDAALGSRGNEQSGIAIQRRNMQTQNSNFHFVDNLRISKRHCGRIIVDILPKVYDAPRAARILGEDGQQEIVRINEVFNKNGEQKLYNLSSGKYDVVMETGPSFATKRQEAVASMIDLTKTYPQMAQVAGDLMVGSMDWPGASDIAERLRKTLPPGLVEDKDKPQEQIPPEVKQQMDQMGQLIDQLTQKLNESNDAIKNKTIEIESKERIEFAKMEVDLKKELLKAQGEAALLTYKQELIDVQRRLDLLGINDPFPSGQESMEPEHQQHFENEINEFGPDQSVTQQNQQQPTGGFSPGQPTGV
ncbi:Phage P22-like portal protein [uncultured Caudovirales phage]|uniref:Phage P22-like portal protein n=1 Tax=uncultured Caudovirales phage TaxID=2100421 RepID=A0A6J5N4N7_9CAUD|nr:Phage P22-like portal protein [uncultured Caudovirales phage]